MRRQGQLERKKYSLVFQFFKSRGSESVEPRRSLFPSTIFLRGLKNFQQFDLASKISFVQLLAKDGLIHPLQLRQCKLWRQKLETHRGVFQLLPPKFTLTELQGVY